MVFFLCCWMKWIQEFLFRYIIYVFFRGKSLYDLIAELSSLCVCWSCSLMMMMMGNDKRIFFAPIDSIQQKKKNYSYTMNNIYTKNLIQTRKKTTRKTIQMHNSRIKESPNIDCVCVYVCLWIWIQNEEYKFGKKKVEECVFIVCFHFRVNYRELLLLRRDLLLLLWKQQQNHNHHPKDFYDFLWFWLFCLFADCLVGHCTKWSNL